MFWPLNCQVSRRMLEQIKFKRKITRLQEETNVDVKVPVLPLMSAMEGPVAKGSNGNAATLGVTSALACVT